MELLTEAINNKDRPIAEVCGGQDDGVLVFLHEKKCCDNCSPECTKYRKCCKDCAGGCEGKGHSRLSLRSGKFEVIPKDDGSQCGYIFGQRGSGKSYWCCMYATRYLEIYQGHAVYVVSYVDDKSSIDEIPGLIRIPFQDILDGLVSEETIPNSLIIFDDIDSMPAAPKEKDAYEPKDLFKAVGALRDSLLTRGRHNNVSVLVTSHLGVNYGHTKTSLNESAFVVIFPKGGNHAHIDRVLNTYGGVEKKSIKELKALDTRWVYLFKQYPQHIISEKNVYLL